MNELQLCENCTFIGLEKDFANEDYQLRFAKCKASKDKVLGRISAMFQNVELQCSVMRKNSDTCAYYMEKTDKKEV